MKTKTLIKQAICNIKAKKKIYFIMGMIIFLVSTSFICIQILFLNHYNSRIKFDQEKYGQWYIMYKNVDSGLLQKNITENKTILDNESGYSISRQYGVTNYLEKIGSIDIEDYSYYGIKLSEGNKETIESSSTTKNKAIVNERFFDYYQIQKRLNQDVEVTFKDINKQKQKLSIHIVGIYKNEGLQAESLFPTIILTQPLKTIPYQLDIVSTHVLAQGNIACDDVILHNNGYDAGIMGDFRMLTSTINILIISIGIGTILMIGITYSSLKSKGKELTLLRGIGATKIQLSFMVFVECIVVYTFSLIAAIGVSIGMSYLIMNILFQEIFLYSHIYLNAFLIGAICSFFMAIIGFFVPVTYTMKNALSGSFDQKTFQYIQVRYRKLKKQNTTQIACRALSSKKRMVFLLIIVSSSIMYIVPNWLHTLTVETDNNNYILNEQLTSMHKTLSVWDTEKKIDTSFVSELKTYSNNVQAFPLSAIDIETITGKSDDVIVLENYSISVMDINYQKTIDKKLYKGRFPEKDDEIFLTNQSIEFFKDDEEDFTKEGHLYNIGSIINIDDHDFKVVGYSYPQSLSLEMYNNLYFETNLFKNASFFVTKDYYEKSTHRSAEDIGFVQVFVDENNYKNISHIMKTYSDENKLMIRDTFASIQQFEKEIPVIFSDKVNQEAMVALSSVSIALIIYVFMNYYDIMNNKKDYAMLKILGITRKQLYSIQMKKAFIITALASLLSLLFLTGDIRVFPIDYLIPIAYTFVFTFIVLSIIYILSIQSLFQRSPLEILDNDE